MILVMKAHGAGRVGVTWPTPQPWPRPLFHHYTTSPWPQILCRCDCFEPWALGQALPRGHQGPVKAVQWRCSHLRCRPPAVA
jgi:hypothetical protein